MMIRMLLCAALFAVTPSSLLGQLPDPTLNQIFPPGAQVGETVQVTVSGRDLDDATQLIFSHPGIYGAVRMNPAGEFENESRPVANQFTVEVPSNVAPGRYDVRAVGRFGASTPRTFYVSSAKQLLGTGGNASPDKAMPLPLNVVLFDRTDANAVDYYEFAAKKGQSLIIECLAQKIDSRLQPVVVVTDAAGTQLRRSRQTLDPVVEFTAPADGEYLLGIHDHIYGGGGDYSYRLQVRSQPYVAVVSPPVGRPGSSQLFNLIGFNLPDAGPSDLKLGGIPMQQVKARVFVPDLRNHDPYGRIADTQAHDNASFNYEWNGATGKSNAVRIGLAQLPVSLEQGDNDLPSKAQKVSLPTEYAGRFYPRRDQDWIEFEATKGQQYRISVLSHRLGHYTDPEIFVQKVVTDKDGREQANQVSTQDDASFDQNRFRQKLPRALDLSHRDPEVSITADQDAVYRIGLHDLYGGSRDDPRLGYRLLIRESEPDYRLVAWTQRQAVDNDNKLEASSCSLRQGGLLPVYVAVLRQGGFAGEVQLKAEGLPPGVTALPCFVAAGRSDAVLILQASQDAKTWAGPIEIVGKATVNGHATDRVARGATLLADTGDVRNIRPKSRLTNHLVLAVVTADPAPAVVKLGAGQILDTSLGAKLEIPVSYVKRTDAKGELTLAAIGVPNEMKPGDLKLAADAKDGKVDLSLTNAKIPPGIHTFFLRGKVKLSYARNPQAIQQAEAARKQFDEVVKQLADTAGTEAARLEAAQQSVAKRTTLLKQFDGTQQSIGKSVQAAAAMAAESAEQLKPLKTVASASNGDADIAKAVEQAQSAVMQAALQLNSAQKSLEQVSLKLNELRGGIESAQQEVAAAEKAKSQVAEKQKRAEEFKKTLDTRLAESKKNLGPKDVNVWVNSTPVTVRVHKSPLQIELAEGEATLGPETQHDLALKLDRRFGFADEVQIELSLPESAQGVSAEPLKLAKDQNTGVLKIAAAKDAAKGDHRCRIKARLKFNGLDLEDEASLVLHIQ